MDIHGIPWQNLSPLLKDKLLVSYIRSLRTLPLWATVTVSELHLYKSPTKSRGAKGYVGLPKMCQGTHMSKPWIQTWNSCLPECNLTTIQRHKNCFMDYK